MNANEFWALHGELGMYHNTYWVGSVNALLQKYRPSTVEEFWDKYIADNGKIGDRNRGRSINTLLKISATLSEKSGESIDDCFNALKSIIMGSLRGFRAENNVKKMIEGRGNTVTKSDPVLDTMGVDLIVNNKYYVQVKPNTFFKGNYNESLIADRLKLLKQEKMMNKPLYIMVYNRDDIELIDEKPYKLSQLINEYGLVKFNEFKWNEKQDY